MRILVYTPTNSRAVDLQSVMELLAGLGHEVFLLSQLPEGDLHNNARKYGVHAFGSTTEKANGIKNYFYNFKHLKRFVREYKIEVVFAHLQGAGVIAGLVSKLIKFKLFYVRHNTNEHKIQKSRNALILNWLANKLTSTIIAPSKRVYSYLVNTEKISSSRIIRINYGYNFNQYLETDRLGIAADIRKKYNCRLLLISVARLVPAKRHLLMFETVKELVSKKMDVKLICISDGPSRPQLDSYIEEQNLRDHIFLLGNQKNIFDYLEASDIFFHLSETEASNSAVKEAGYCGKTAVVCSEVGDFDDYIESGVNGYLIDKINPVAEATNILQELYRDADKIKSLGENLRQTIISEFEINKLKPEYIKILTQGH